MNDTRMTHLIEKIGETNLNDSTVLPRVQLAKAMLETANELLFAVARETRREEVTDYICLHLGYLIGDGPRQARVPTVADWIEDLEDESYSDD